MRSEQSGVEERRVELAAVMVGVAEGRQESIGRFYELAVPPVRALVQGTFAAQAIRVPVDTVDDIVQDLVVELIGLAGSWRPDGGAAPWNWARSRLVAKAFRALGTFADDIDDHQELAERPALHAVTDGEASMLSLLERLAAHDPRLDRLHRGLTIGISERDRGLWLEFKMEEASGNRAPAVTVGQNHDMKPNTVRKVVQRVGERLDRLAATNAEFADLAELPVLAA